MSALVRKKLNKMDEAQWRVKFGDKEIVVQDQFDRLVKAILFGKEFISSAVSADPHAGLAWAGVCVLLPVRRGFPLK